MTKSLANSDIRQKAKEAGVTFWQIANFMGVCELTVSRRLRFELSEQERQKFIRIIDNIALQNETAKN